MHAGRPGGARPVSAYKQVSSCRVDTHTDEPVWHACVVQIHVYHWRELRRRMAAEGERGGFAALVLHAHIHSHIITSSTSRRRHAEMTHTTLSVKFLSERPTGAELRRRMAAAGVQGGLPALALLSELLFGRRDPALCARAVHLLCLLCSFLVVLDCCKARVCSRPVRYCCHVLLSAAALHCAQQACHLASSSCSHWTDHQVCRLWV